ncbi:MAG: hypothetical protein EPO68_12215 [Planctomycetota bacterium]|nr:MAG: hypothetical protein EPO68_12215 [Planctomycetota bacterium]
MRHSTFAPVRVAIAALAAAAVAHASNQVFVVGPVAGPGIDFTNVQSAINAAANGDIVLLRSGTYAATGASQITISGKGLTLVADAGQTVNFSSPMVISNVGAGQMACVRRISVSSSDEGPALSVFNNAGSVWIENGTFAATSTFFPFLPTGPGIQASNCADLKICRAILNGATIPTGAGGGYEGIAASGSNVCLYDTQCTGGNGGNGANVFVGGDGARINGGFCFASGCTFKGGKGGNGAAAGSSGPFSPCTNGSAGGNGLHLVGTSPSAATLACTFTPGVGGNAGTGGACVAGPSGVNVKVDAGSHSPLGGAAHSLDCSATCREGQFFLLTFKGVPGELAFIDYSGTQGFTYFPDFKGVLALGFPLFTLFQGTIPGGGTLTKTSATINDLGLGVEGVTLYLQAGFFDPSTGAIFQGSHSATALLDSSL